MVDIFVPGILKKMSVFNCADDGFQRFVATSDLLNIINKEDFKLNSDLDLRAFSTILQTLDDPDVEVAALAFKCLASLVTKVHEAQLLGMTDMLCNKLLNGEYRDINIANLAFKIIFSGAPTSSVAQSVLVTVYRKLVGGLTNREIKADIKCQLLDFLCDILLSHHEVLLGALLPQLSSNQATVREKTVSCIASLASSLSDSLLVKAIVEVVRLLGNEGRKSELSRTYIQMIGALSCVVGNRYGPHLEDTVPILFGYCMNASDYDEELCEYSFQALESSLLRCLTDISSYCNEILHLALKYITYDPNLLDNVEENTDDEIHNDEEEEDDDRDDEYDSWKVRMASAKCLTALIVSHPEMLPNLYNEACPKLIDRFKEREENVKMDVFNTFIELLRQTGNVTEGQVDINELRWSLEQHVPKIVKSIKRQMREKSIQTKIVAFSVLKELLLVLPGCLADHIGLLIPEIVKALCEKSSTPNLKIEALIFTRLILSTHSIAVFHPYIEAISAPVLSAIREQCCKVTAEALIVCNELVRVMRPNIEVSDYDFEPYVHPIYNAIMLCLSIQNQYQEVKECAISCMGLVVSTYGDYLTNELPACLSVLVDQMGFEITRPTAVKALRVIAACPLHLDLSDALEPFIVKLTAYLQKADRALRRATLRTLNTFVVAYGDQIGSAAYEVMIVKLSTLISDSDLHVTTLALKICCMMMSDRRSSPIVGSIVRNVVLPQAVAVVKSELFQGLALLALHKFLTTLVRSANMTFDALAEYLLSTANPSPQSGGITKQALFAIAQCVAVLCLAAGDNKCSSTVKMLTDILQDDTTSNSDKQHLALLCLGEIGRRKDLSSHVHIENIVIESFQSPFEEIKSAASYALGNIAVGNLPKYLPFISNQIDNQQEKQYLLLHSLKEVIVRQSVDKAEFQDSSVEMILNLLFNHCESEEEGVRNVVAECLGKIALIKPSRLVPALKERTTSPAAFTRETVVVAVKYSIVERPEKIDSVLYPEISSFLMLIKDQDRHVRRAAVLALSIAGNNKPNLIKGLLPQLLPLLYDQTCIKKELMRTVDLGPFKHTVDDGLELRKAAFECVDTLLDNCLDQLNPSSFIVPCLKSGLDDHYDVKLLCHLILSKLADKCPSVVLAVLDSLVEPLHKSVTFRPKQDAVQQELNRNRDMIGSALTTIKSLDRISGGDCMRKVLNFKAAIVKSTTTMQA